MSIDNRTYLEDFRRELRWNDVYYLLNRNERTSVAESEVWRYTRLLADVADGNGMIHLRCSRSVTEIVDHLESVLKGRGARIFARIDHSRAAAEAGIMMRPMQVLLFGNPAVGTPMMIATPTSGIDLPSKVLVWEDEAGTVWLTYNTAEYLKNRHGIPVSLVSPLKRLTSVLGEVAKQQRESGPH